MKFTKYDKGIALILVLFFSLIASLMILAVMYMVLRGTAMSGMQKQYQTSLDAAYAGVSAQTRYLKQGSYNANDPMFTSPLALNTGATTSCAYQKLYFSYGTSGALWTGCSTAQKSVDALQGPDATFQIKGLNAHSNYQVFEKIVDTRRGLTAQRPPGVELGAGVAAGNETGLNLQQQAYVYYAVEVKAKEIRDGKPRDEVARISFDYAW